MKGEHLMKMITKFKSMRRSRTFLLSIVCSGAVATLLGGCAESPYATRHDPTGYTPGYHDYYGNPYSYSGYGPRELNHGDRY
jgi:hypothetical protein